MYFFLFFSSYFCKKRVIDRFYLKHSLESRYVSRAFCSEFERLVSNPWVSSLNCPNVCFSKPRKSTKQGELPVIRFYFRYLESCSIPALKRKCKSSANTSSSSSEDDKQVQQSQQEVEALEGNTKHTDHHNRTATADLFCICCCCTFQGLCPLFKLSR